VTSPPSQLAMGQIASGTQFACGLTQADGTPRCWGQVRSDNIARDFRGKPIQLGPFRGDLGNQLGDAVMLAP